MTATFHQKISTARMPVIFVGHGSPMNAIEENPFTLKLKELGERLPRPHAILVVSAHWMSEGTWITGMENPKTIHDFYGFPQALFEVQYPAPGSPSVADLIKATLPEHSVSKDLEMWGLDHGAWSVLRNMYPKADVPVVQLSIYMEQPPEYHFKLGQMLSELRAHGILLMGSGNLVHNLRKIDWDTHARPYDWAVEFDRWTREKLETRDFKSLVYDFHKTEAGRLSVPSMDHYYPLHYVLGAVDSEDELQFEFEEIHNAAIAMRTFLFTPK